MPTVYSYYEQVEGRPKPDKLLDLWRRSWEAQGWETKVLSESDARSHPAFGAFSDRIRQFSTVNPPGYERACYIRHLAMANQADEGPMLMLDYDVLLNPAGPKFTLPPQVDGPAILEPTRVPCMVLADVDGFMDICDILVSYQQKYGENHVSDMTILRKSSVRVAPGCVEHLDSGRPIVDDPGDGWKTAPAIHFSSFSFSKLGWRGDKADLIQRVLASL